MVTLHGWTGIRLRFILIRCGGIVYRISRTLLMQKLTLISLAVFFFGLPDFVPFSGSNADFARLELWNYCTRIWLCGFVCCESKWESKWKV
jgi:hypothetical protein